MRQNGHNNLRVMLVTGHEQRADRTVDQARNQRFTLGGTTFALEIATGNTTGRKGLFLIVHGQREEIHAGFWLLGRHDSGQHGGFAIGGQHGAVSLTRNAAGFQHQLAAGPVHFYFLDIEHGLSFSLRTKPDRGHVQDDEGLTMRTA